jgi:hypothetical protein
LNHKEANGVALVVLHGHILMVPGECFCLHTRILNPHRGARSGSEVIVQDLL